MSSELEQFLKQAAQIRFQRQQAATQQAPPLAAPQPLPPLPAAKPAPRPLGAAESIGHDAEFSARASQMGQIGRLPDDRVEQRVHDVFDHRVGTLQQQQAAVQDEVESPAAFIRGWLQTPGNVRIGWIVGEVLRRPTENW